ncbi:TIGR04282 family arsenosugar biosynthesis glycosyltransferase [Ferruginibacter sp.]|uniref:TIGR04282 family arsenosugar biosynthesis glycosyltransferase n=1 Tax=Ferruginibacter sp. TaxID=1940288 RepID=UPI0019AACF74|nr:TIGR04282 family arsenosugar biosynthesis glycosyltransferase [Ferruginibacter sp.]MBC7629126.1 TIGR04282 family arsenosugar biosynthesis glycosyltransferase [Ferruginibacter sp.]
MSKVLIIFIKNPVAGKVKTRLAATVGDTTAVEVYKNLLHHTQNITHLMAADKFLFYADFLQREDEWPNEQFIKHLQKGNDLGKRMHHALEQVFLNKYKNVLIIGSDCFELTAAIIEEAYLVLEDKNIVIGPAKNDGCYLLGMKNPQPCLFKNVSWSTSQVLQQTISICTREHLNDCLLPTLTDIDDENDLSVEQKIYFKLKKSAQ